VVHLRIVAPADHVDRVLRTLEDTDTVINVAHFPGVARKPHGDVILADVPREDASIVISDLRGLGIDDCGSISIAPIETQLSRAGIEAERRATGSPADAVIWEEVVDRTSEESTLSGAFIAFIVLAMLIASVGIFLDSPILIVGAMVVGPEFGPLAALAVGLVLRRWDLVRLAGAALGIGFPLAMVVTLGGALLVRVTHVFGEQAFELKQHSEVDFVFSVGVPSLVVAMLAGAAGMLAMTSAKSAALVGVFISVTTVPAAGYAVVAAVAGEWNRCVQSVGQLLVNLLGIVAAAAIVLIVRRNGQRSPVGMRPLPRG
jgi:uncharacterized hydrophobic protein (TIGR00271 family)